ncbi:aminotransferase class IV [Microbulbifer pacificus]|uniref:Aminotransferase class IV n=1 Tax=Microbulbifer pacificus TaxID=407164 RepID=A0AAU0N0Q6_9GAMM|nr:aminotransferase class IV [Microbulbifer pacificus]WOX05712.1 aminotransferase class IV [Microbulbifer pacificus]
MTQSAPQFYSSSGSQQSLPDDGEFSSGLLETMRAVNGAIPLLFLHLARFARCAHADSFLLSQVQAAAESIGRNTACWRYGGRVRFRYGFRQGEAYWDFAAVPLESESPWDLGVNLICCETVLEPEAAISPFASSLATETRSGCAPVSAAGCKLLQRSLYERAAAELSQGSHAGTLAEGLLFDSQGYVIEALRCNLLLRKGGRWLTPDLSRCGVRGVMLEWLAGHAEIGEHHLNLDDVLNADELAVCNGVRGVVPVVGIQCPAIERSRPMPAGPATSALQQLVAEKLW